MDQKEFSPPKFGERELIGVVFRRATFKVVWLLEQNILIRINRRIQLNLIKFGSAAQELMSLIFSSIMSQIRLTQGN